VYSGPDFIVAVVGIPVAFILQVVVHSLCAVDIHFYNLAPNNTKQTLVTLENDL
jgi:hypothetical protein